MVPRAPEASSFLQRPPHPIQNPSVQSKTSAVSLSPSNEADDERSASPFSVMGSYHEPEHAEEDRRPTSQKELAGFYAYGFAAEAFVVCGIGSFIPITLEQLARENGVLLSDRETPCSKNTITTDDDEEQCVVNILGTQINTASFAMYTFSLSVLVQALVIISISGAADHGRYRKAFLIAFATLGAIATMLFLPVSPSIFLVGALLAIIANTSFGASFVLLNSFLPILVRYHPSIIKHKHLASTSDNCHSVGLHNPGGENSSSSALLSIDPQDPPHTITQSSIHIISNQNLPSPSISEELALSTRISAYGLGVGYIAAGILQLSAIFIILLIGSSLFSLKIVLFSIGAWWLIFSFPAAIWLRPRPGPPLVLEGQNNRIQTWTRYLTYSWKSLGRTILRARKLKDMVLFLTAWFLVSDAIATVSGTAVLFAKTTLQMKPAALALINVIATLSGIMGAFSWRKASDKLQLNPNQTILACICLLEIIPLYGLLGFVPFIKRWGVIGLQQPWELYPLGAIYGFCMGGLSTYCRSVFAELIPPGSEAAFFALYAITDKGSSIFGPAIVGAMTDAFGEIRPAFWFLAGLISLTFPLMYFINIERGKQEAVKMAKILGETETSVRADRPDSDEGDLQEGEGGALIASD